MDKLTPKRLAELEREATGDGPTWRVAVAGPLTLTSGELRELVRGYREVEQLRQWCRDHRVMLPI